ncbi:MAG TPA: hypothetical protein VME46_23150 [Acidimicrobiales bacterium]|nr:hypothetical protein [Acidimicrobiales bacterium]
MIAAPGIPEQSVKETITAAAAAVLGHAPDGLVRLPGGMNNVLYRLELDGRSLVAKVYFSHAEDPRDRLGTEFRVASFLWGKGARCIPEPVGLSQAHGTAFYSYIEGKRLSEGPVTALDMESYAQFVLRLWELSRDPAAAALPNAAEAAFSVLDRLSTVVARLWWLQGAMHPRALAARAFLADEVAPLLERLKQWAGGLVADGGASMDAPVPRAERTVSPGDVGLHNCLRTPGGLVFHDFEYGGWDDVAQVIVQTCLAPGVPVPVELHPNLLARMVDGVGGGDFISLRVRLFYPFLAVKWGLIMLNELVEVGRARRSFAGAGAGEEASRLEKARRMLAAAEAAFGVAPSVAAAGVPTEGHRG